jgi:hypothetical protein
MMEHGEDLDFWIRALWNWELDIWHRLAGIDA